MAAPVGRPVGTSEGVQRGWPLPLRLAVLVVVVGGLGLWLASADGGEEVGGGGADPAAGPGAAALDESGPDAGPDGPGDEGDEVAAGSDGAPGSPSGDGDDLVAVEDQPPAPIDTPDPEPAARLIEQAERCDETASGSALVVGVVTDQPAEARGTEALEIVAARHAATLINCVGGVSGRPLEVVAVDLAGSPLTARDGVDELLEASPVAIIGPRSAEAGLRLLEALGGQVPVLFPLTTEPALDDTERAGFLLGPDTAALARAAARFARDQGWSTAATFSAPGPHVALGPLVFAEAFEAGGGTARLDMAYEVGRTASFSYQIARLVGPSPQDQPAVIFTTMPVPQLIVLQNELDDAAVDSALLTVDARAPTPDAATLADGTLIVGRPPDDATPGVDWFEESYRNGSESGLDDPRAAARVGDAMLLVAAAVERVGDAPASVSGAFADGLLLDGLSGPVGTGPLAAAPSGIPAVELTGGRATLIATLTP